MRNFIIFLSLCFFVLFIIFIGIKRFPIADENGNEEKKIASPVPTIPSIGRIEVLNGCGIPGAAGTVADFLREKRFDVKNIENAPSWNYPYTIVVSRTKDRSTAEQVCAVLNTDKLIILRTGEELYNVSVFIGSDFGELIK